MNNNTLVKHYVLNYQNKIFLSKIVGANIDAYFMYVYDYDYEFENFRDTFAYYLPYYVRNKDFITAFNYDDDIDKQLAIFSKAIRKKSEIIPKRPVEADGIYGELFLDFYLHVVCHKVPIITYGARRSFSNNNENYGIDEIVYYVDENEMFNICYCETKFVTGAANAKNKLVDDIIGNKTEEGHINKKFLNKYTHFVVEKGIDVEESVRSKFKNFIDDINRERYFDMDFVSLMKKHNVCINFIFFAIFDSKKRTADLLEDYYKQIYDTCLSEIEKMDINNYKIEIVFIPTNNKPIDIKKEIEKFYE